MLTQSQRERWLPTVDRLLDPLGYYAAYGISSEEHTTSVTEAPVAAPATAERVGRMLEDHGYEYNGLSALKYLDRGKDIHDDGSYRKVPDVHPDAAKGKLIEAFEPGECQYHVHLFDDGSGSVELYSHYEARPDLLGPWPDPLRLLEHYRPKYGETYLRGVACPAVEEVLQ